LIPLSILFSILRYRLWEIDLLLNRTLVYGLLTVAIVAGYILLVGILSILFQGSDFWLAVIATGMIALLFQPLRQALQRGVNRLLYGERDDPATVLARLGQRLEGVMAADAVLPTLVETVAQALKLPYAAVALRQDGASAELLVAHGKPPAQVESFPLLYQGEPLGRLDAAPRAAGEQLTAGDRRLLADIAHQAGPAVHALLLTADLQRSRTRLVTAREEERRRLRRDLHDGLGPQLATLAMQIDAARNLLSSDPGQADHLLQDGKRQMQEALAGIRRLVYDLRPPALDQLGLVSALRDHAAGHAAGSLQVVIDAPEPLPPLPAAVEVAAYRIALEALTNVVRHAQAQHCWLRLRVDGGLLLEVEDDGRGLAPDVRHGVGITAMVERAAELGGTCMVQRGSSGGTVVRAWLPVVAG
jgi:signal transduction histidine kinase